MRSKSIFVTAAFMAILLLTGANAFGQIRWLDSPEGVSVSNNIPGKAVNDTLRIILGENSQLTTDQWLEIDLSDFQVNATQAAIALNYSFSSNNASLQMDNATDFGVEYTSSTSIVRLTLVSENALVPGDSVTVMIKNVTAHKGKSSGGAIPPIDYRFTVRSSDQPVFQDDSDEDNLLTTPGDNNITAITLADTLAQNTNWVAISFTASGQYPKDGILEVILPSGFTYDSDLMGEVEVTVDVSPITIGTIAVSGRTMTIPLNDDNDIPDGAAVVVTIGSSDYKNIINPQIYTGGIPFDVNDVSKRTYDSGVNTAFALSASANEFNFTIVAFDASSDTIAIDKSGSPVSFTINSNWFLPQSSDGGSGSIRIGDNTAGNFTSMDIYFQVSTRLDTFGFGATGEVDTLYLQFETDEYQFELGVGDSLNYSFNVASFADTNKFTVNADDSALGIIKFVPKNGGFLDLLTTIKLTIATGFVRNLAATPDVTVSIRTSDQTTLVNDRDTDPIQAAVGGVITFLALADSNAGEPSAIDSMVFTAGSFIPRDAQFVISFPSQFQLATSIDTARIIIDSAGVGTKIDTLSNGRAVGPDSLDITISGSDITLKMKNVTKDFPANSIVIIELGDTTQVGGITMSPAFTNPLPADKGAYPTAGLRSPIVVKMLTAGGGILMQGDNSSAPVNIRSIDWGLFDFQTTYPPLGAGAPSDSQASFIKSAVSYATPVDSAGNYTGLRLFFSLGTELVGTTDTLFVDLGKYFDVAVEEATANISITNGVKDDTQSDGDNQNTLVVISSYNTTTKELAVWTDNDTLAQDSIIVMTIAVAGSNAGHPGGMLNNKGKNTDIRLSIRTSRQNTAVSMDSTWLAVVPDTLEFIRIVRSDSVAGETSNDSLVFTWRNGKLDDGKKLEIKLQSGNSFSSGIAATDINIVAGSKSEQRTITNFSLTRNSDTKVTITLGAGDTLGLAGITVGAIKDTAKIYFGNGVITNTSTISRRDSVFSAANNNLFYSITAFDENSDTMWTQASGVNIGSGNTGENVSIVSNYFAGGPISILDGTPLGAGTFTAGQAIDTLVIPFQVGAPIIGDNSVAMILTFHGAIYTDVNVAGTDANYLFTGDTSGMASKSYYLVVAEEDSIVRITFKSGQNLGGADGFLDLGMAFHQDTLYIMNVLTAMGTDGTDGIDVEMSVTSVQTTSVTDTTYTNYTVTPLDQNLAQPSAIVSGGFSSLIAGASSDFTGGWIRGSASGTLFKDGIIRLKFPIENDSAKTHTGGTGVYQFSFPTLTDPGTGVGGVNSGAVPIGYFRVIGGMPGGLDTMTIASVTYDTLLTNATANHDTALFTITMNDNNTIHSDSTLIVQVLNILKNPTEAVTATNTATAPWDNTPAATSDYKMVIELRDLRNRVVSRGASLASWSIFTANTVTQYLVLNGLNQKHDPGGTATGGITFSPDSVVAGDGISFEVLAVDAFYNIVTGYSDPVTISVHTGSGAADGTSLRFIGDENAGTAGNVTMASGIGSFDDPDSLRIHQAQDGNTILNRSGKKVIKATRALGSPSITGSSDLIPVTHGTLSKLLVILSGKENILAGDSLNNGKENVSTPIELAQGGTYTVNVYPVDVHYNRIDTTHTVNGNAVDEALKVIASGLNPSVETLNFDATSFIGTFTIKPTSTGTGLIVTVQDTATVANISALSTFNVIGAITTATFEALADSTELAGRFQLFTVELSFSGEFGTGEGWSFFTHSTSGNKIMNSSIGGILQISGYQKGAGGVPVTLDSTVTVATETEGDTIFIYATIPSINDSAVAESGGFVILHQPIIDQTTTKVTPGTADRELNSGGGGSSSIDIDFEVVDVDDAEFNVPVYVFLDENASLTNADFTPDPVSFGTNSILISPNLGEAGALNRGDNKVTLDIVNFNIDGSIASFTTAGDYYVYVVAYDGKNINIGKSDKILTVKHAPSMTLDRPVTGTTKINTSIQQKITINWTTSGDQDIDDNAAIALYIDTTGVNHTTATALLTSSSMKTITGGFTLTEDNDATTDDQFVWDLASVSSSNLPISGGIYDFYALIQDGKDTTLSRSPGKVQITHDPVFTFNLSLGLGASKGSGGEVAQVVVDMGQIFRVNFTAIDLDQTQNIRLFITQLDVATTDYEDLDGVNKGVNAVPQTAWLMNSADGTITGVEDLTTADTKLNWYSENMDRLDGISKNGDYFIYAFIRNDGSNVNWRDLNTEKFVANGKVKLTGRERTVTNWDLRLVPDVVSTNKGDLVRFDIFLDSKGEEVEEIAFYLDIDTSLVSIVDPTAPFKFSATTNFFGNVSAVEDTTEINGSKFELNFQKISIPGAAGTDTAVAYFEVIVKDNFSSGVTVNEIFFANDQSTGRFPRLTNNGVSRTIPVPTPAITVLHSPLGRIQGRVPLQSRANNAKEITLELRELGSLNPIDNTDFNSANDQNETTNGLQITTDSDGFFELLKVPTGTYQLVAKTESYLSGQFPTVRVLPGDILVGKDPTFDNAAIPNDLGELKGGDVSSGSAPGVQDDVVDGDDINFLITNFGINVSEYPSLAIGDIDGSGSIAFEDLAVASANFGLKGIPPFGNKLSGGQNSSARIALYGVPDIAVANQEFTVAVKAEKVDDLFGFIFMVDFNPEEVEFVREAAIIEGDFLKTRAGSAMTIFFSKNTDKGTLVVGTLLGVNGEFVTGDGVIAELKFRSLVDDVHPNISLLNTKIANSQAEISRLGDVVQVPEDYRLQQNYPNPFNPETKIRFELPKNTRVTLKIFNVLGQEVVTLINTDMKSGYHLVKWNGKNQFGKQVASGVYYYRLETTEFSKSMRMLLIK